MNAYIRITRGDPAHPFPSGSRRLAHTGRVEAVAQDGTTVDISNVVTNTQIVLRPGEVERVVIDVIAFEVES